MHIAHPLLLAECIQHSHVNWTMTCTGVCVGVSMCVREILRELVSWCFEPCQPQLRECVLRECG